MLGFEGFLSCSYYLFVFFVGGLVYFVDEFVIYGRVGFNVLIGVYWVLIGVGIGVFSM